jgi:predicted dehydrogenase
MLKVGVIGYGYWGPNLVRNFSEAPGSSAVVVSDTRPDRLTLAKTRYPSIETTDDYEALIHNPQVDAVAIATPVSSHHKLMMAALKAGKHVFVEKPMAASVVECEQALEEAARRSLLLHVDHTFVYTGAVRKIHEMVSGGEIGEPYYYDSVRVNLGLFQHDVNVIWDLAVHDISIMDYIFTHKPVAVSTTGISHVKGEPENIAYVTLFFDNDFIAHIHVNWLAPVKVRRTLIGGSQKMIVYDDLEPSEKIKVYDKGITLKPGPEDVYQMLIGYRTGDMWAPQLDMSEALRVETSHFAECVAAGKPSLTSGEAGLRVVQVLEAATRSMQGRGAVVEL